MNDKWLLVLGGLCVVMAVFGLKVWHAHGVCDEMSGRCLDGECHFDERSADVKLRQ